MNSFKQASDGLHHVPVDDLQVRVVTVRAVSGLFAGTEQDRLVFFGRETDRRDARGFGHVSSVTERLSKIKKK